MAKSVSSIYDNIENLVPFYPNEVYCQSTGRPPEWAIELDKRAEDAMFLSRVLDISCEQVLRWFRGDATNLERHECEGAMKRQLANCEENERNRLMAICRHYSLSIVGGSVCSQKTSSPSSEVKSDITPIKQVGTTNGQGATHATHLKQEVQVEVLDEKGILPSRDVSQYWKWYYDFWDDFVRSWFEERRGNLVCTEYRNVANEYRKCVKGLNFDELPEPYYGTPAKVVKAVIINLNPGMSQTDERAESLEREKFYSLKDTYEGKGPHVKRSLVIEFADSCNKQYSNFVQKWSCLDPKYRHEKPDLCGVKWWQGTLQSKVGGRVEWLGRIYNKDLDVQTSPSGVKDSIHPLEVFALELCPYHSKSFNLDDENLDDETWNGDGKGRLEKSGNAFGGGYVDDSSVDITEVRMYGGWVRNSLYGGGEIATIGRGDYKNDTVRIFMPGTTNVYLYGGHVLRDVFGGGRGFNNVNDIGQRNTNGFIMGKTNVYIHGGEVGTAQGTSLGYGNVFGGGNIGFVYSDDGVKAAADNDDNNITAGYYYDSNNKLTEDCKVVVAPACKVIGNAVTFGDGNDAHSWKPASLVDGKFTPAQYVPIADLNTIELKSDDRWKQLDTISGVKIHNAVFAGGNITRGSDLLYAEAVTVFGNATASLIDVFCMDLITIGEDEIGGLYGDGNLTFVDGYRELNITNYGTDYYDLKAKISTEEYFKLKDRIAKECVDIYEEVTGCRIRDHIEEIVVASPMTWARYLGTPRGDVYGYEPAGWDGMFPRVQSGHHEDYTIHGLRFAGGHGTQMDGYSQAYLSGAEQARYMLEEMKKEGK